MDEFDDAMRGWKVRVEQIERILTGPNCNPATRYAQQLIEEKQKLEGEIANIGRIREARFQKADSNSRVRTAPSRLGQNINKFRKECGWSYDVLAEMTGIDKKLILSHVTKGAKPHPRIVKEYAQAFTKALKRTITVADIEE